MVKEALGYKFHWAVADYLQRSARHIASATDVRQAYELGQRAVELALEGKNSVMPTIDRTSDSPYAYRIGSAPLDQVANAEKFMPRDYISADGYGISDKCRSYLLPLIQGEDYPAYRDGLPVYVTLQNHVGRRKSCRLSRSPSEDVRAADVDPSRCPLCGEANRCAMEIERETGQRAAALLVHAGRLRPRRARAHPGRGARPRLHLRALRCCCCDCCRIRLLLLRRRLQDLTGRRRLPAALRAARDHLVDELQLAHGHARQHEGVVVGLAHAARQLVEHVGEAHPAVEEVEELAPPRDARAATGPRARTGRS